jgi:hypothetical protein
MASEWMQEFKVGDTVEIKMDVVIEGVTSFKRGERAKIEHIQPHPDMPDFKYVVVSPSLNKPFTLSAEYLSAVGPASEVHKGVTPPVNVSQPGGKPPFNKAQSGGFLKGMWRFDRLITPSVIQVLWWIYVVIATLGTFIGIIVAFVETTHYAYSLVLVPVLIIYWFFALLFVRILFEVVIVFFQMKGTLDSIDRKIQL